MNEKSREVLLQHARLEVGGSSRDELPTNLACGRNGLESNDTDQVVVSCLMTALHSCKSGRLEVRCPV